MHLINFQTRFSRKTEAFMIKFYSFFSTNFYVQNHLPVLWLTTSRGTFCTSERIFTYVVILAFLSLFKIVFLSFQLDNGVPEFISFGSKLLNGEAIDFQRFDANAQRDFLLLLELFFRLVALQLRRRKVTLLSNKEIH